MPRLALLIAGSAALAETTVAELWARARLAEVMDDAPPDTVVLVGRCPKAPDQWASEHSMARHLRTVEYDGRRGARYVNGRCTGYWYRRWNPDWRGMEHEERVRERDRVMVKALVEARRKGWQAKLLALLAPWAKTHGTVDVVAWAREVGIEVEERRCPVELGP